MRLAAAFGSMILLTVSGWAAPRPLGRVAVSGSDYVRLADWGQSVHCAMRWDKKEGQIELSGPSTRLNFTVDSRRAEISGVAVWLSLPVASRNGAPLIALADVRSTLEPLVSPRKSDTRVQTICLDAGHGGKDPGHATGRRYEKKYTLLLAEETAAMLQEQGFKVVMTRTRDEAVELSERPLLAARQGADLFVSLHYNTLDGGTHGVEVFCLAPAGMGSSDQGGGKSSQPAEAGNAQDERNVLLGYQLQKSITQSLPLEDLGLKRSRFEVLRLARMPAVLIEGGFLSNPQEAKNIYDGAFRKRMARAIVKGIVAYQRAISGP